MNAREIMVALLAGKTLEELRPKFNDFPRLIRLRGDILETTGWDGSWIEHSTLPAVNFDMTKVREGRK